MKQKSNNSLGQNLTFDTNESRTIGLMKMTSDFDRIEQIDPFCQMSHNPAKMDRCAKKVQQKGNVDNARAVCNASLNRGR